MALVQLYAYGASDVWLVAYKGNVIPYNLPQYNYCSFLHGEMDISTDCTILHEYGLQLPFEVKKDKAARMIQQIWMNAISNPSFGMCKRRLLREYREISTYI